MLPGGTGGNIADNNSFQQPTSTLQRSQQGGAGAGAGGNQQLHQELLISAENASHAAIDLLSKLSLRMAPGKSNFDPILVCFFCKFLLKVKRPSIIFKSFLIKLSAFLMFFFRYGPECN